MKIVHACFMVVMVGFSSSLTHQVGAVSLGIENEVAGEDRAIQEQTALGQTLSECSTEKLIERTEGSEMRLAQTEVEAESEFFMGLLNALSALLPTVVDYDGGSAKDNRSYIEIEDSSKRSYGHCKHKHRH